MNTLQKREKMTKAKMEKKNLEYTGKINGRKYIPKTNRIILCPTENQRKTLNQFISDSNRVWNVALHSVNIKESKMNEIELRNKFVIAKRFSEDTLKRMGKTLRTPKRVREYAIKDLISSYKACLTNLKQKNIKRFTLRPKNKRNDKQTIVLPHEGSKIKSNCIVVCGMKIKIQGKIKDTKINHNMRCSREGLTFFVYIPEFVPYRLIDRETKTNIVSVDLGINIFATNYSPNYSWDEVGIGIKNKLNCIYKKQEGIENSNVKRKRKKIQKSKLKIVNLIDDFQWKTVHWYLQRYGKILISRLYVSRTSRETKRHMNDLKHCRFVDRLIYKSMFYRGREIHIGKEHYTSSYCTLCGSMKIKKGKTISCDSCGFEIHRDLGGSRNFLIKHTVLK